MIIREWNIMKKNVILELKEGIIHLHFAVLCDILHKESKILGENTLTYVIVQHTRSKVYVVLRMK